MFNIKSYTQHNTKLTFKKFLGKRRREQGVQAKEQLLSLISTNDQQ